MKKHPQGKMSRSKQLDKWLMASLRSKEDKLLSSFKTYSSAINKSTPAPEQVLSSIKTRILQK